MSQAKMKEVGTISKSLIEEIKSKLEIGEAVRVGFGDHGRLNIDRPLPFLCVYRQPEGREDRGTANLLLSEASYLIAENSKDVENLIETIAKTMADRFATFLIIEIWSAEDREERLNQYTTASQAKFRIFTENFDETPSTVKTLRKSLENLQISIFGADVTEFRGEKISPPRMESCLSEDETRRLGCLKIGLEVSPIYRDAETGELYHSALRVFRRQLSKALQETFFEFVSVQTAERPTNPQMLGRRSIVDATWSADAELCALSDKIDYLRAVTPVNSNQAYENFKESGFNEEPDFHYRLLTVNQDDFKRKLYRISFKEIEDPTMLHLLMEKRIELDRQITLIGDRNTPRFIYESLQLFPPVEDGLLAMAKEILDIPKNGGDKSRRLKAKEIAKLAESEINHYQTIYPKMTAKVEIREDMPSGLVVSSGNLTVGHRSSISENRINALLQHEIGTHSVTYFNGRSQSLKLLYSGLPGYEQMQEGLAVFAEYLVGGLTLGRMRTLAARVIAVKGLVDGKKFAEVFDELCNRYGFSKRGAFNISMRVFRGGGLTKDAVYLRGLKDVLDFLKNGGDIETLFIGKMGFEHTSIIEELRYREVLHESPLTPRYMDFSETNKRLENARKGISVKNLIYL